MEEKFLGRSIKGGSFHAPIVAKMNKATHGKCNLVKMDFEVILVKKIMKFVVRVIHISINAELFCLT
jgi:hypothetical protein